MSEEYARELSKMAVSKAAVALGYKFAQPEAVDCLADVMRKYIEELAEDAQSSVESYGRTNPGILDMFSVLQKPGQNVTTTWRELKNFAIETPASAVATPASGSGQQAPKTATWNQPFPCPIAPFPVKRKIPAVADTSVLGSKTEGREDLPDYLPEFPPAHTYRRTRRRVVKKVGTGDSSVCGAADGHAAALLAASSQQQSSSTSRSIQAALSVLEERSSK